MPNPSYYDFRALAEAVAPGKGFRPDQVPGVAWFKGARENSFKFVAVGDLEYRAPEFLIDGLVETECVGMLFGDPEAGKTFVAIDMAMSIASGTPYHGRAVRQGAVFYIAGEGHNGLTRRFAAWGKARGVSTKGVPLFKSERAAQFLDNASTDSVIEAVEDLSNEHGLPALIVLDTVARNFGGGDENSTQDMGLFIAAIDDLRDRFPGCTILLVHHSGHADKQRARGAMALKGALDFEYRVDKSQAEGVALTLTCTKMKDAARPAPMAFTFVVVPLDGEAESVVPVEQDVPERGERLTRTQKLALQAYVTAARVAGVWVDDRFQGVDLESWREAFHTVHTGDSQGAKKKAFQRVRADLQAAGQITVADDLYLARDHALNVQIMQPGGERDKRDKAGHFEKCPGAEAGMEPGQTGQMPIGMSRVPPRSGNA